MVSDAAIYEFDDCELDCACFELRRGGVALAVEPQVFDLLRYLVEHRDRVVGREELFDALWAGRIVSDAALSSRVKAARRAIGDNGRDQRLIRTVHGRGFRFTGEVGSGAIVGPAIPTTGVKATPASDRVVNIIGRHSDLALLVGLADAARSGVGTFLVLAGEAGMGKTALLKAFLARASGAVGGRVAVGQCVAQRQMAEPYLPLLDALGRLCRADAQAASRLQPIAPSWLQQLPALHHGEGSPGAPLFGPARERMLRELVDLLQDLVASAPLILALEDVHWADESTLGALDFLARRGVPAGLLIVATYRTGGAAEDGRRVADTLQELRARGLCRFHDLPPLSPREVAAYLERRVPALRVGEAERLHAMSNGNPFFMEALADWWIARGAADALPGPSPLLANHPELGGHIPPLLLKVICAEFDRLAEEEQKLLEWAALAGAAFSATLLADASGTEAEEVEAVLSRLVRRGVFVAQAEAIDGPPPRPDFAFIHALHREAIAASLPSIRRRRMHAGLARALAAALGPQGKVRASELAAHCLAAGQASEAVGWLYAAARRAGERGGPAEALASLRRARDLLDSAEDEALKVRWAARIEAAIAPNLVASEGPAAAAAEAAFRRAAALAEGTGDCDLLSTVLYELATLYELRGEFDQTQAALRRRRSLAPGDDAAKVANAELMACSAFHQGRLSTAVVEADAGLSHYDIRRHRVSNTFSGRHPAVSCEAWAARALCFMGYPDTALARIERGLAVAAADVPFTLANAHEHAAYLRQHRGEAAAAVVHADEAVRLGRAQNLPYRVATGSVLAGWARTLQGGSPAILAEMEAAVADCERLGVRLEVPYLRGLLAEAWLAAGDPARGLAELDLALASPTAGRGYYYLAELYRLRAMALLARGGEAAAVRAALFRALDVAAEQGARLLELRAATGLAGLGDVAGRDRVAALYSGFAEGFGCPDLEAAVRLLGAA